MTVNVEYTRPFMYPYQTAILNSPARYTVTEAATKVGKTASHIIWLFEQAAKLQPNQSVWWIAPVFGQSKIAFSRMKNQISVKNFFRVNESNMQLTLPTGGIIRFKSADKPDNLFGDDVYAAVFDEFTRAREESWHALRSTLTSTGGPCKFIGNVKGKKNWGYHLAQLAKGDNNILNGGDYDYFKITAYDAADAGMLTKDGRPFREEIEKAKNDLPTIVFNELYLAEASEDGTNPFGYAFIDQCTDPISSLPAVCYGVDLAKTTDWTVIIGLDKNRQVCHFERFQKDWRQTLQHIKALPKKVPMAIDSTGVGDPIGEDVARSQEDVKLVKFTSATKQQLMEGLAMSIQGRKILFPKMTTEKMKSDDPGHIQKELKDFEFQYTRTGVRYGAPEGQHDDCVCGLALADSIWRATEGYGYYATW